MRIVGGKFKGHGLTGPKGQATRPTSDRVREAIFNILAHGVEDFSIEGARVLDLFAGTGAMGLEALSRGARFCQFVDDAAEARGIIRRNADALGLIGQCKIWRRDATRLGPAAPQPGFDLVFADPPYGKGLGTQALKSLIDEAERAELPCPPELKELDRRIYGETQVLIARASPPPR
jgi:16S rRNA (guanine966-N2)-methyltransferase